MLVAGALGISIVVAALVVIVGGSWGKLQDVAQRREARWRLEVLRQAG